MAFELVDKYEQVTDFLLAQSGVTGIFIHDIDRRDTSFSSLFFKPMKTSTDLKKLYSPISAPIALSILTLEFLVEALVNLVLSLYYLLTEGTSRRFSSTIEYAAESLLPFAVFLLAAIVSPIANLVDLAGSVITTGIDLFCTKNDNLDSDEIDSENEELDSDSESSSLSYN